MCCVASLIAPGFGSLLMARGGESVFRSSLFRAGYELFYTPIPGGIEVARIFHGHQDIEPEMLPPKP